MDLCGRGSPAGERPYPAIRANGRQRILSYRYEPNPSEFKPKMYNWEIRLNHADSRAGAYEVIQMTRPTKANAKAADVVLQVLVESKVIAPGQDGAVHFNLVFPGAKIERVAPSPQGTRLVNGKLSLIQFIVSDDHGEQFQTDVVLTRK